MQQPEHADFLLSDHVIGIVGLLLALLGLFAVFLSKEPTDKIKSFVHGHGIGIFFSSWLILSLSVASAFSKSSGLVTLAAFVICCCLGLEIWRAWKVQLLHRRYEKVQGDRWNLIKEVKFGHLEYEPFLMYRLKNPIGFGVVLLKELLEFSDDDHRIRVSPYSTPKTWDDVLKGMGDTTYQVVATPLFATFDRSKEAAFTSPLFFSNVGLYVHRDTKRKLFEGEVTVDELTSKIEKGKLRLLSVPGEISSKMAKKYAGKSDIESCASQTNLQELFSRVANEGGAPLALFCESFYAAQSNQPEVVNVLHRNQILYPVCFAVRHGDVQLRNLLNIRLLSFAKRQGSKDLGGTGVLDFLAKELPKYGYSNISVDALKEHFVEEWPSSSSAVIAGSVHA